MNTKSNTSQSGRSLSTRRSPATAGRRWIGERGFLSPRLLVAVLLCMGVACSIVTATLSTTAGKLALRHDTHAKASQRTLSFAERVSYQRAIEDVYWRHRIWPKERPDPKPSLDAVMTQVQLEQKVEDYLRKSQALEDHWQRPITAEQLQAEMNRMAQHSKQPEVLQELFEALGNDPFVIAECLARPALAERLLTNSYAYDQRIHGELKQRAEADLQAHLPAVASAEADNTVEQMKQFSGKYSETELVKSDSSQGAANRDAERAVKLDSREWDQAVQTLAATFNKSSAAEDYESVPVGKVSSLQEDENRYYATAVIEKGKERLRLATVTWQKEPLGSWVANAQKQLPVTMAATSVGYALPNVSDGATCIDDTWTATSGPPDGRGGHTAVWTGTEMIIWGGGNLGGDGLNTGGRYNPATDNWTSTSTRNSPQGRSGHSAVWTGTEMIIWGGSGLNTGGRYNPATDSWTSTSSTNAPSGRDAHTAVWTGSKMIVWGGYFYNGNTHDLNTGGRYDPVTNSWTTTSIANAPAARDSHTAVWTGGEMIVWGGTGDWYLNTGGRYNPSADSWTATSTTNAPTARTGHTAVWTGTQMIVWGGDNGGSSFKTGGRYNPSTNSWTATTITNAHAARSSHTAVWSGSEMIIWGGYGSNYFDSGGRYNPNTNNWTATSIVNAPSARSDHTAVWSGTEMIVWGGVAGSYKSSEIGGRYNPVTNSWASTGTTPTRRSHHTAVWTGSEMIVWGGFSPSDSGFLNTGGRYDPSTDNWMPTSTTNAPAGRFFHTAVWTGSEMVVWGGYSYDSADHYWNTGGRYDPGTDSWRATSLTNAPAGRESHTAVWTGREMIVWGGDFYDGAFHYLNTGGRYDPVTNTWTATSITNAPAARSSHQAVWTGGEMIVWGGAGYTGYFDTGGRYNPSADTWRATNTTNAPVGRTGHRAVWTGNEMIVWGGYFFDGNDNYLNTGGRYNPNTNSWMATSTTNAPDGRSTHTAIWTGNEMIVWGGLTDGYPNPIIYFNTGGRYHPGTDTWTATSTVNAPDGRYRHTAVWTGSEMIVWGSTRAFVQTGDNVMIGGFIVQGTIPKRVIIRAIGPELGAPPYNVPNALANPTLELHDSTGALIGSNDNWQRTIIGGIITNNQVGEIRDSGYAPGDGRESAIIADLPAGNYTAIVRGIDNMTGVALVEVYDLSPDTASILGNISTRSFVETGDNVMIGGFIVQRSQPKRVIIRAIGPELSAPPYNIPNALANPTLELHDGMGALIASNDTWLSTIIGGIITTNQIRDILNSGYAPSDGRESAIIADLPPGNYTAIVRGVNNTTGVALVEVYDLQ